MRTRKEYFSATTKLMTHGGSLALVDQAVVSGANFATSLAIARVCGKSELGVYMLAWTITSFMNELLTAVILTPYNVISPTLDEAQQKRYRGSMLLHQGMLSLVCMVFLAGGSLHMVGLGKSAGLGRILGVVAVLVPILVFREFVRRMYFAHLQMRAAFLTDAMASASQLGLIVVLMASHALSAIHVYLVLALCSAIPGTIWLRSYWGRSTILPRMALIDLRCNWTIARWTLGSGVLWAGAMYSYPWLLVWMHGTLATGAWAACYGLVALSNPVLLGCGNYLGPKIAILHGQHGVPAMRRYVFRSSVSFALLLVPLTVVAWTWGNALVVHLYGPSFAGYTGTIRILAINVLIVGATFPFSRGLFSIKRADLDLAVNVLAILILFCFGFGLVRTFSVLGAAAALAFTSGITAAIRIFVFAHATSKRARTRLPVTDVTVPIIGGGC